ncbi:hypothetical protein H4I95_01112 [Botrytis cinerea]
MMILQGHRSNSLSSDDETAISAYQEARQFHRRDSKLWARDSPFTSYKSERQANLTPFNTMHMPRLDSVGSQEHRSHMPIWSLYIWKTIQIKQNKMRLPGAECQRMLMIRKYSARILSLVVVTEMKAVWTKVVAPGSYAYPL